MYTKIDTSIQERKGKKYTQKFYRCDSGGVQAMEEIVHSGVVFESVSVSDVGDVGMKIFDGDYSFDEFMQMYDRIRPSIDMLVLTLPEGRGSILIISDSHAITLVTEDPSLELNDILEQGK